MMNSTQALSELKALKNEATYKHNVKSGAGDKQFGVKLGDIRAKAKSIKHNPELAKSLWDSGILDAQLLAILLLKPKDLDQYELSDMVASVEFSQVADWLTAYLVKKHPDKETLRLRWFTAKEPMLVRAAWSLTAERVAKSPDGLDFDALLDQIESQLAETAPEIQWTMNMSLAEIGIQSEQHRARALAIGERLGVYRDFPTSKGCTSPFAPIWINEIVSRQSD